MSLLMRQPHVVCQQMIIMLRAKLGTACKLAWRMPKPPLLMFKCAIRVESWVSSLCGLMKSVKNSETIVSIPCVRGPNQLNHCWLSRVSINGNVCMTSESRR